MEHAIFNGKLINKNEAKISIADKGYFFDFSVYSSLKVIQGKIFFPDFHVKRLFESARLVGINHQFKESELKKWLVKLVEKDKIDNALLRIVLIGNPEDEKDAKIYIFPVGGLTFYPDKFYKQGAKVITYLGERRIPKAKSKDLLMSYLAYGKARKKDALDALLIDHEGFIREGTRTNFFAIKGNTLITPADEKVLGGITRKIILEIAKDQFEIKFEEIATKDLKNYDELFISSTSMNVMPVRQIDDIIFETDFEKTRQIAKLFKDFYDKEILKNVITKLRGKNG